MNFKVLKTIEVLNLIKEHLIKNNYSLQQKVLFTDQIKGINIDNIYSKYEFEKMEKGKINFLLKEIVNSLDD